MTQDSSIAVVGMAGRFPGADSVPELWRNLSGGIESITFFREAELELTYLSKELLQDSHYVKAAAILRNVEGFDAAFFALAPAEASILSPQHRLFLECCWKRWNLLAKTR